MITETPAPTDTPIPTATFTPSPTFTPTLNFYIEVTTPAGEAARIERTVTIADYTQIVLLFAILISLWVMFIVQRFRRD